MVLKCFNLPPLAHHLPEVVEKKGKHLPTQLAFQRTLKFPLQAYFFFRGKGEIDSKQETNKWARQTLFYLTPKDIELWTQTTLVHCPSVS